MASTPGISNAMSGLNRLKPFFFDREAVKAAVRPARRKYLNWAGALVRKIAQRSMRTRKAGKASAPGTPPAAHSGGYGPLLRRFLYYAYDKALDNVVVGPIAFKSGDPMPAKHEFGSRKKFKNPRRTWRRLHGLGESDIAFGRTPDNPIVVVLKTKYMVQRANRINEHLYGPWMLRGLPPRPYMRPALNKVIPQLPKIWQDSVKAVNAGRAARN